eukprot:gene4073-5818_t
MSLLTPKYAMLGSFIHSLQFGNLELIERGMLVFDSAGTIESLLDLDSPSQLVLSAVQTLQSQDFAHIYDYSNRLILPGFVDAHCHAPQYVFTGTGMDLPLLAWLEKYTFPCEARFQDVEFAKLAYSKSIARHLKYGTTFASYFATLHSPASKVLAEVIQQVGQRAHVGKVSMDRNSPDFYIEDTHDGCIDAEEFSRFVLSMTAVGRAFVDMVDSSMVTDSPEDAAASQRRIVKRQRIISYDDIHALNTTKSTNTIDSFGTDSESRTLAASVSHGQLSNISHSASFAIDSSSDSPFPTGLSFATVANNSDGMNMRTNLPFQRPRTISMSSISESIGQTNGGKRCRSISMTSMNDGDFDIGIMRSEEDHLSDFLLDCNTNSNGLGIKSLLNKPYTPLVLPCVTPRFVPTCTPEMMERLGAIAKKYGLPVQSHMSESPGEIAWVADLHPDCATYASVYEKYGLLNENVYMAHCCHSGEEERSLLKKTGASVVHCASSNFNLGSGVMDVRAFLKDGIKVAFGTDVAGGHSASMLDTIRLSIVASRVTEINARQQPVSKTNSKSGGSDVVSSGSTSVDCKSLGDDASDSGPLSLDESSIDNNMYDESSIRNIQTIQSNEMKSDSISPDLTDVKSDTDTSSQTAPENYQSLNYKEAFHLATVGGAEVLGMGNVVGNFMPGKKLDCIIVDVNAANGPIDLFGGESALELFQKFLFLGDDRNIQNVFVNGRQVI